MFLAHKKGISEIISYVLLVVIALSLGVLVYVYLTNMIDRPAIECSDGISLSLDSYTCDKNTLSVTFSNNGRFNVDGALIRIRLPSQNTGYLLNGEDFAFINGEEIGFKPNDPQIQKDLSLSGSPVDSSNDNFILDIQILNYDDKLKRYVSCPNIISQNIVCR